MYRGRLWTMRQFAGFGTAEETNARFRYLLDHGQTGLSTAFDMPTLMGYDSDHPRSLGEVGREGVAIDSLADMETLFAGIPLGEVSTSMTINAPAAMLLAFYVVRRRGAGRAAATSCAGRSRPTSSRSTSRRRSTSSRPSPRCGSCTDMIEFCAREMPQWHPISISGYHIREAGSTAAQELAFTLADGFAYVECGDSRAGSTSTTSRRGSRSSSTRTSTSSRRSRSTAPRAGSGRASCASATARKNPRSWLMRFHTQTAGVSLTAQQPEVNIVRTAIEALAAVLGGTQSLHTNSFDEALALPTENAVRIALRTQQVIAHETGVVNTIDPLGGSYFVEELTNRLEAEAYDYFERIDELGGVVAAIEENFFQREIAEAAFRYQREVEAGSASSSASTATCSTTRRRSSSCTDRPRARAEADRARPGAARAPRLGRGRGGARRGSQEAAAADAQPDAADRRRLARLRHDGRDVRRAARGVGRLARDAGLLSQHGLSHCRRR